jgi:hypothetical protein
MELTKHIIEHEALGIGESGGSGDVVGPASAIDGNFAVFDGATGKLIKDGGSAVGAFDGGNFTDTFYDTVDFDCGAF